MLTILRRHTLLAATVATLMLLVAHPASAHVGISPSSAPEGSTQTFTLEVGHGCDDSPTSRVLTDLSGGFDQIDPVDIDGWDVTLDRTIISWTAQTGYEGSVGKFSFTARVTASAGTVVPTPVIQECVEGRYDWVQVLAPGQEPSEVTEPAPLLTVTAGTPVETTTIPPDTTTTTEAVTTTVATSTTVAETTTVPAESTTTLLTDTDEGTDDGTPVPLVIGALVLAAAVTTAVIAARRRSNPFPDNEPPTSELE